MLATDISVIVPSYNGRNKLPKLLSAIETQTIGGFELLIVIDGSTDDTAKYLSNYDSNKFEFKFIIQENKGRAAVRNHGAKEAKGQLLIFFDDDMSPTPDAVERHLQFHKVYLNAICGGNQLENPKEARTDFDKYRCYIRIKWNNSFKETTNLNRDSLHLTAANFSIPKSLFQNLGGFDETLTDAEDICLAYKALDQNIEVYFDPHTVAWHNDFCDCKKYILRRREYQSTYEGLSKKIKESWVTKRIINMSATKHAILYIFSFPFYVKMIDKNMLVFLPEKLRYRIYDVVITSLSTLYSNRNI